MVSTRPRSFAEYALAQGAGLGGVPNPVPLPHVTLNPPPPPIQFGSSPTLLSRALGLPAPPAPLPAAPGAAAAVPTGSNPVERVMNEIAIADAGAHDPTVSAPAQALRAASTGANALLQGADLPRQVVTAHEGDEFIHDISRNNEWSVIMTVMNNLGALNAPLGVATQRPENERAIVPDAFAFGGGSVLGGIPIPMAQSKSIDQLTTDYATFMSQQSPEIQRQVWNTFQQWHAQKRAEYYTPGGDLKRVIDFKTWQALNYDKALNVYLSGWQKPAALIPQPDGTSAAPQVNDNPRFTGGQAVWEAYVNELDPAQRLLVDIQNDPTVILGGVGKGVADIGASAAERGLPGVGRALTGVGAGAEAVSNAPIGGADLLPNAITRDRGAAQRIGRAAAATPGLGGVVQATDTGVRAAARNYERVVTRLGMRVDPWEDAVTGRAGAGQMLDELRNVEDLAPQQTAAADAAREAARQQRLRVVVPKPGAPIGKWGKAEDGVRALYVDAAHPDVRIAQRQAQQGRVTVESRDVEVWNIDTGTWDTVVSHPVTGGGITAAKATTAALRDANAHIDARFQEVGAGPGAGVYDTSWDGPGIHDLRGILHDTRITTDTTINQDALLRARQKVEDVLAENPIPDTPSGASVSLVLTDDEIDTIKDAITVAGGRTMTPIQAPPMSEFTIPTQSRITMPPLNQPMRALPEPAIPLGPGGPSIEQLRIPTPSPGSAIEQAAPPLPPREPRIEQATLPTSTATATIERPELPRGAGLPGTLEPVAPVESPAITPSGITPAETTPAELPRSTDLLPEQGVAGYGVEPLETAPRAVQDTVGIPLEAAPQPRKRIVLNTSQRTAALNHVDPELRAKIESSTERAPTRGPKATNEAGEKEVNNGYVLELTREEFDQILAAKGKNMGRKDALIKQWTNAPEIAPEVAPTQGQNPFQRPTEEAPVVPTPQGERVGRGTITPVEGPGGTTRYKATEGRYSPNPFLTREAAEEWLNRPDLNPEWLAGRDAPMIAPEREAPPTPTQQEIPPPVSPAVAPGTRPGITPVQRIRHDILKSQYPGRPIAYALPNGEFQLLDDHAPYGSTEVARFSGGDRKPVSSYTGTREEILANAPEAIFVDPAKGFRATGANGTFIPPPVDTRDFHPEGIRTDIEVRSGTSAPIDEPRLEPVIAPFREAMLQAAPDDATAQIVRQGIEDTKAQYLAETESGYLAKQDKAVNHEIKGALTLARGIVATMEDVADNGGVLGRMPEIAYGAGVEMTRDRRGDFDWVMRSVFGASRESKRGTPGFFGRGGERGAKEVSAGAATRAIMDQITRLTARGETERAAQYRGLLTEVEELRRRYIDLIQRQSGTDYYAGVGGPVAQRIGGAIGGAISTIGGAVRDVAAGAPQPPGPETLQFLPDTANKLDLLSEDARTAAQVQWVNHPEFAGQSSFTVREEIHYQARQDIEEYRQLAAKGVTVPAPTLKKFNGKKVLQYPAGLSDDQKRMKDIALKYQPIMPLGETLETADPRQLGERSFMREFLIENGKLKQGQEATNWLSGFGRWLVGLHRNVNSASAQIVLHDPTNFRYMLMNYFGNPALLALRYPKAAARALGGTGARVAYGRYTEGTFSPIATLLRSNPALKTGFEMHAAEMGMAVPRQVLIDEKYSHEKAAKGVRNLMDHIGLGKYAGVAEPFDRGARIHIGMESHQRGAGWWARSEERVAEAWADTRPAVDAYLRNAGLGDTALADIEEQMPRVFGAARLYDAVRGAANNAGKSEEEAAKIAKGAYDLWVTPSRRASYQQAVADIAGPMPLNRRTPLDDKLGMIVPFSFWNLRISDYLLKELYGSPFRMAAMERYQDWAEDYQRNNPTMPGFLKGYINLTQTPFGMFLAANPVALLLTQSFLDDTVTREGVNRTAWDEVTDALGSAIGISPMPNIQFLAQALGYSRDQQLRLPYMTPPSVKTFGAMIDYLSVLSGGEGGKPIAQDFWTWASRDVINPIASRVLPGAERSYLRDPELARVNPVHYLLIQNHPELLDDLDLANEVMGNDDHPWMREAWTQAAAGKLFTQSFNQASPVLARAVIPTQSAIGKGLAEQGVVNDLQSQAVAGVEADAAALPGVVPLGTSSTPGTTAPQPVGTADWRTDPRWANHLTGGPAPDVQSREQANDLYLANDLAGSTPEFRRIIAVENEYQNIGTPLERQAYADWSAIAYGTPMRTVDMGGGRVYSPADVLALPDEERKVLADEWVMTHAALDGTPLVPVIESYRTQRDMFISANPEWAAYDSWRDGIRTHVESGGAPSLLEWGRQEAERNPNFKRHYDDVMYRVQTGEYDQERAEGKMLSVDAYLADHNIQQNVTDPAIIPATAGGNGSGGGLTEADITSAVMRAMNSGSAYNPAESIRQDMQAYSRDLMVINTFMAGIGYQNPNYENLGPAARTMMGPLLSQYGITPPSLSADTQAYLAWAQAHPDGTPEQFLQERQQQLTGVMTTGLPQSSPAPLR